MKRTLTLALTVWMLSTIVVDQRAAAQSVPAWMQVSAAFALSSEAAGTLETPVDPQHARSTRRGAYMIAAGAGLFAAGVLIPSLINDRRCEGSPVYKASMPGGITVGIGGLVLTAFGIYKLHKQPYSDRQFRRGDTAGFLFTTLGTATVASGALAFISASQIVACIE